MAVLDFKVSGCPQGSGWRYGRYRLIRRGAADDPRRTKGAGTVPWSYRVWSWRTAPWPSDAILELADALGASEVRHLA